MRFLIMLLVSTFSFPAFACLKVSESDYDRIIENEPEGLGRRICPPDQENQENLDSAQYVTPTKKLATQELPFFHDDLNFKDMIVAIDRQLARFKQRRLKGTIRLGREVYPLSQMKRTLEEFRKDLVSVVLCQSRVTHPARNKNQCLSELQSQIHEKYDVFMPDLAPSDPRYGEDEQTFFTSYYTPTLKSKMKPEGQFRHGIYRIPENDGKRRSSRVDIDFKDALKDQKHPLFWTTDLFDLYLLHVQGGGKVEIDQNGSKKSYYISYAGTNKQSFRFISKYMMEKGMITNGSIGAQRSYLEQNPDRQEEIYAYCPSYVYFKTSSHPPAGSDMVPLTDNRSLATDYRIYKMKGMLSFVEAKRPNPNGKGFRKFSRFMIDQDTGGAIKGKARVDLYFGEDKYAERAAYSIQHTGNLYFLMLKHP